MDASVYRASLKGSWEALTNIQGWSDQLTYTGDTVLHIHLRRQRQKSSNVEFIKNVLDHDAQSGSQSLLWHENANGETPLHVAAKFGHTQAIEEFLQRAKLVGGSEEVRKMLLKVNKWKDTSLHLAARAGYDQIVKLLVEADPRCPQEPNDDNETPLYLAAESESEDSVVAILDISDSSALDYAHQGPCGQTALHVLIQWNTTGILQKILEKAESHSLVSLQDETGSTPLHRAAALNKAKHLLVLLSYDKNTNESAAYIKDDKGRIPLHLATLNYNLNCVEVLLSWRPDCIDVVDSKGQNVLHYAADWACIEKLEYFLELLDGEYDVSKLINDKDLNGNTPLHLVAANIPHMTCGCYEQVTKFMEKQRQYLKSFNKKNFTVGELVESHYSSQKYLAYLIGIELLGHAKKLRPMCQRIKTKNNNSKGSRRTTEDYLEQRVAPYRSAAENQLIVAALVATVSFTAGFTVPGGLNQNPGPDIGVAVMTKKTAFQAFMISDAAALTFSSFAVFLYFIAAGSAELGILRSEIMWLQFAELFTVFSVGAMIVAFMTGVYAVVPHSVSLQTAVFVICGCFLLFYILQLFGTYFAQFRRSFGAHPNIRRVNSKKETKTNFMRNLRVRISNVWIRLTEQHH